MPTVTEYAEQVIDSVFTLEERVIDAILEFESRLPVPSRREAPLANAGEVVQRSFDYADSLLSRQPIDTAYISKLLARQRDLTVKLVNGPASSD
jgi:hypothetical protein